MKRYCSVSPSGALPLDGSRQAGFARCAMVPEGASASARVPDFEQLGSGPEGVLASVLRDASALRVQVPNNHILTQNLYYNYYYPKPKYLIIGYMDPLGRVGVLKSGVPFLVFDNKPEAATWHGYVGVSQN